MDESAILEFVDAGHNLVITGSRKVSRTIRDLASECGVEFADKGTRVIDHFNYDSADPEGSHTLVIAGETLYVCGHKHSKPPQLKRFCFSCHKTKQIDSLLL